jgi:ABC-2 type transport system ATP-binding protein
MRTSVGETTTTGSEYAIDAHRLRVRAGRHLAVDELDLTLGTGVHGLLGPNGAGKTTLVRALATVLRPAGGSLTLLGCPVGTRAGMRAVRRSLGYLPQEFGFYPRFTVREFVEYLAWIKEVPGRDIPAAARRAIGRVGLADRADARMRSLSAGMVRRVGIAQAIVNDPRLLLLDEPTAGLDPEQRMDFRALLREVGTAACVLVSTHLVEDVVAACADVTLIDAGHLVFSGTPADLQAAAGDHDDGGDSPAERGYSTLLRAHRGRTGGSR